MKKRNLLPISVAMLSMLLGVGALQNPTFAAPAHSGFSDEVFYGLVVRSALKDENANTNQLLTSAQLAQVTDLFWRPHCSPSYSNRTIIASLKGLEFLPNLEVFRPGVCSTEGIAHFDFSGNPKLKKVWIENGTDDNKTMDLSKSPLVEDVLFLGVNSKIKLYLSSTPPKKIFNVAAWEGNGRTGIVPDSSTRATKPSGLGAEPKEDTEEYYELDLSKHTYLNDSNTDGITHDQMTNEQLRAKDEKCSTYDAKTKIVKIKASCVADGLKTVTMVHTYTANGRDYTSEFEINLNLVKVLAANIVDGKISGAVSEYALPVGASLDTDKYLKAPSGYTLKSTEVVGLGKEIVLKTGDAKPTIAKADEKNLTMLSTSTATRKYAGITNNTTEEIIVLYNYEKAAEEDLKIPNTSATDKTDTKETEKKSSVKSPDTGASTKDHGYLVAFLSALPLLAGIVASTRYYIKTRRSIKLD
ncbi:hypothetical protein IKF34_00635 [Candidatus Saccharibacteria bacterium]|nr:hypothetical protein [Candidatus Saccharibacteria bacterium]